MGRGLYFPSNLGLAIFWVVYIGWASIEVLYANLKLAGPADRLVERSSRYILYVAMGSSIAAAFGLAALHVADITQARAQMFYTGVIVILFGIALRLSAIRTLGPFFLADVAFRHEHRLVDRGIYSLIRHPAYAGTLITYLGMGLTLTSWASLAAMTVIPALAYAHRIRVEESALSETFGDEYTAYVRRTKQLIPFVL